MIAGALLGVLSGLLAVPTAVLVCECVASLKPERGTAGRAGHRPRVAVLVPAHDEEAGIARTLASIRAAMRVGDRLLVVADNCTDRTAAVARRAGAEVIERRSEAERGKGYALSFGVEHLAVDPPDVVVIIDADCEVRPDALDTLADVAASRQRPAQAEYLLVPGSHADTRASISAFAILVRNRTRPRGLTRLGLPCQLTGSGMAFPWPVIRDARPTGSHVVEDLVLGLDLTRRGLGPVFAERARVTSPLPNSASAQGTQRRRWETGQLSTLIEQAPRLLLHGLSHARGSAISSALDLSVPPLALHVTLLTSGALMGLALPGATAAGLSMAAQLLGIGATLGVVWWAEGRAVLPASRALAIPAYVAWKIPLYLSFALRGKERTWIRTQR